MRKILLILALFVSFSGTAQNSKYYPIIMMMAPTCDADALAFISATGITDATQKSAICTLVTQLKDSSLWTKLQAIYPYVGGTATTHKYNLKDTATFKMTWSGGLTHDANGVTSNGTTGYGNTTYSLSVSGTLNNTCFGGYYRTDVGESSADMGVRSNGGFANQTIYPRFATNTFYGGLNRIEANWATFTNTNSQGFYTVSRADNIEHRAYKNGVFKDATADTNTDLSNIAMFVCCYNENGTPNFYSTRNHAFDFIGLNLTDAQQTTLYNIVQAFQTALGRQI